MLQPCSGDAAPVMLQPVMLQHLATLWWCDAASFCSWHTSSAQTS